MPTTAVPPILTSLVAGLAEAVPRRARTTFTELLLGAATTRGGHVTDAILAAGLSRSWTSYYWFLQRGRWAWLAVWRALLGALQELFAPPVWHVVIDDTLVERISSRVPGSLVHHNHAAKPKRSRFLRGQGWLCLAAVVERGWRVGAVPLMLRLVRRGTHRGKLVSARFLVRLLGRRLGRVRLLLDAWFMRARLIEAALADGHTVTGRARRDLALYAVPRRRRRGRPRKYGPRMTPERVEALPAHRSARILYGKLEVVRLPHLPGGGPLPEGPGGARGVGAAGAARPAERGAPAGLHRPGPARDRGHHELRQEVERGAVVRGREARLGARGRLAAVAPGADALGDDPGRRLRAQPGAGLPRPGPHPGPRQPGAVAAAWDAHGRADPGGPGAAFAQDRSVRPHARDRAKIGPANRSPHRAADTRRCRGRLSQQPGRQHAHHATADPARWQDRLPVNFSGSSRDPGCRGCGSGDEHPDERGEEGLSPSAGVVHDLEEGEVERQLLLGDAAMRAQPGAQQRPEALGGVDVGLAKAVAGVGPRRPPPGGAHRLWPVAPLRQAGGRRRTRRGFQ